MANCLDCPKGTFDNDKTGSIDCAPCATGHYNDKTSWFNFTIQTVFSLKLFKTSWFNFTIQTVLNVKQVGLILLFKQCSV